MLNRRAFLKTGLQTGAAAIPVSAALNSLDPAPILAEEQATTPAAVRIQPNLIALPSRLAAADAATRPWQRRIRRVGQTNMTEHDPVVMNIEEWADYWHFCSRSAAFLLK